MTDQHPMDAFADLVREFSAKTGVEVPEDFDDQLKVVRGFYDEGIRPGYVQKWMAHTLAEMAMRHAVRHHIVEPIAKAIADGSIGKLFDKVPDKEMPRKATGGKITRRDIPRKI